MIMSMQWYFEDDNYIWQAIKKLGDDVLKMQQEVKHKTQKWSKNQKLIGPKMTQENYLIALFPQTIATEVKNIFWGLAKCLMYNPGQVKEKEWMSLLA